MTQKSATEHELSAMYAKVRYHYLIVGRFVVRTDHQASLFSCTLVQGAVAR